MRHPDHNDPFMQKELARIAQKERVDWKEGQERRARRRKRLKDRWYRKDFHVTPATPDGRRIVPR